MLMPVLWHAHLRLHLAMPTAGSVKDSIVSLQRARESKPRAWGGGGSGVSACACARTRALDLGSVGWAGGADTDVVVIGTASTTCVRLHLRLLLGVLLLSGLSAPVSVSVLVSASISVLQSSFRDNFLYCFTACQLIVAECYVAPQLSK